MYTIEQAKEVLEDLKDWMAWGYLRPEAQENLKTQIVNFKDRNIYLSINEANQIEAIDKETNSKGVYIPFASPSRENSHTRIYDFQYLVELVNKQNLSDIEIQFFQEFGIFVTSFFQRVLAAYYLANIHDSTIQIYADQLCRTQRGITSIE